MNGGARANREDIRATSERVVDSMIDGNLASNALTGETK